MTIVGDQKETIAFLKSALSADGSELPAISTHASLIFLTNDRAFKLKCAVRFPFLDFSTAERRRRFCEIELALNRRTAPDLYLGVCAITRETDGHLAFDGVGELVDTVIEMRRFRDEDLFDTLAERNELTASLMTDLARQIAALHKDAVVSTTHGGASAMARVLKMNEQAFRDTALFPQTEIARLTEQLRAEWQTHELLLNSRRDSGKVRRCHGDLILRNICLFEGRTTLFDCLEFDEELATIDVLYDLAFLLMDLWRRDRRDFANVVFNRYFDEADETSGLPLLPFFMATRAAVRAYVAAAQAIEAPRDRAGPLEDEARAYFALALHLLQAPAPVLVAIGGLSGSGKSTVAAALAPDLGAPPGARILASDRIRKALYGVAPEARLKKASYRPEVSAKVYGVMREKVRATLATGFAAIADAVFDCLTNRNAIAHVAQEAGVRFAGFWLEAPKQVLLARLAARIGDPSDATPAVIEAQTQRDLGEMSWQRLDTKNDPASTRGAILDHLVAER